jgi:hypothetical protein
MGDFFISDWLRNRNTVEFLGIWESVNNPDFNYGEFAIIKCQAGLNSYKISVKEWVEKTNAIGLVAKAGRYGGTFAHVDIAFEFGMWISPEFKVYLVKVFKRLKEDIINRFMTKQVEPECYNESKRTDIRNPMLGYGGHALVILLLITGRLLSVCHPQHPWNQPVKPDQSIARLRQPLLSRTSRKPGTRTFGRPRWIIPRITTMGRLCQCPANQAGKRNFGINLPRPDLRDDFQQEDKPVQGFGGADGNQFG